MKPMTWMAMAVAAALLVTAMLLATLSNPASPLTPGLPFSSPTPTWCPVATPEPFWVEPVTSPTRLLSQDVTVYLGNCEAVTVTAESGTFATSDGCYPYPTTVNVILLPNTTHHLEVLGKVRRVEHDGCFYGGYTLRTDRDKFGAPLVITQQFTVASTIYLPCIFKDGLPKY